MRDLMPTIECSTAHSCKKQPCEIIDSTTYKLRIEISNLVFQILNPLIGRMTKLSALALQQSTLVGGRYLGDV